MGSILKNYTIVGYIVSALFIENAPKCVYSIFTFFLKTVIPKLLNWSLILESWFSGLSGRGRGEVSEGHGVQRSAGQREVQPDVSGGHAARHTDGAGRAALWNTQRLWGENQGEQEKSHFRNEPALIKNWCLLNQQFCVCVVQVDWSEPLKPCVSLLGVWTRATCSQHPAAAVSGDEGDVKTERGVTNSEYFPALTLWLKPLRLIN